MKIRIEINGQIDEKQNEEIRKEQDKILKRYFQSYKFTWEMSKGLK